MLINICHWLPKCFFKTLIYMPCFRSYTVFLFLIILCDGISQSMYLQPDWLRIERQVGGYYFFCFIFHSWTVLCTKWSVSNFLSIKSNQNSVLYLWSKHLNKCFYYVLHSCCIMKTRKWENHIRNVLLKAWDKMFFYLDIAIW